MKSAQKKGRSKRRSTDAGAAPKNHDRCLYRNGILQSYSYFIILTVTVTLHAKRKTDIDTALQPGPHRKISHSEIWKVDENRIAELDQDPELALVGDCTIYFYSS